MNLKEALLSEHSRVQTDKIIAWVGGSPERFRELMFLFFEGEKLVVQRSAWSIGLIACKNPDLFYPYLDKAVQQLYSKDIHDAAVRNILRIIQDLVIPEHLEGPLLELCLGYINQPKIPGAIKAFAITTLENICSKYPELASEVLIILNDRIPYESPAYVSRGKRFIKRFAK